MLKPFRSKRGRPRGRIRKTLAAAAAAFSMFSCEPEPTIRPPPVEIPPACQTKTQQVKIEIYDSVPMESLKGPTREMVKALHHMQSPPRFPPPMAKPGECGAFCEYLSGDFPTLANALHERVTKRKDKMKLTYDQAMVMVFHIKSAFYLSRGCSINISHFIGHKKTRTAIGFFRNLENPIPKDKKVRRSSKLRKAAAKKMKDMADQMLNAPNCRAGLFDVIGLVDKMPNTTMELFRCISENKMTIEHAEEMADYLERFLDSMKMGDAKAFDEYISRIVGREWSEIAEFGRKKPRDMRSVRHLKRKPHLKRFLEIQKRKGSLKSFSPKGGLPADKGCPCKASVRSGSVKLRWIKDRAYDVTNPADPVDITDIMSTPSKKPHPDMPPHWKKTEELLRSQGKLDLKIPTRTE